MYIIRQNCTESLYALRSSNHVIFFLLKYTYQNWMWAMKKPRNNAFWKATSNHKWKMNPSIFSSSRRQGIKQHFQEMESTWSQSQEKTTINANDPCMCIYFPIVNCYYAVAFRIVTTWVMMVSFNILEVRLIHRNGRFQSK